MKKNNELKFKLTFKNDIFGDISIYHLTELEMKSGALNKILSSGMRENGYSLIDICKEE